MTPTILPAALVNADMPHQYFTQTPPLLETNFAANQSHLIWRCKAWIAVLN